MQRGFHFSSLGKRERCLVVTVSALSFLRLWVTRAVPPELLPRGGGAEEHREMEEGTTL